MQLSSQNTIKWFDKYLVTTIVSKYDLQSYKGFNYGIRSTSWDKEPALEQKWYNTPAWETFGKFFHNRYPQLENLVSQLIFGKEVLYASLLLVELEENYMK